VRTAESLAAETRDPSAAARIRAFAGQLSGPASGLRAPVGVEGSSSWRGAPWTRIGNAVAIARRGRVGPPRIPLLRAASCGRHSQARLSFVDAGNAPAMATTVSQTITATAVTNLEG
jgi:hypothetical protein